MKRSLFVLAFLAAGSSLPAQAQLLQLRGSDTLFGAMTDAINQAGLQDVLQYIGGGSGLGESGLVAGTQAIAPMSRALNAAALASLRAQGVVPSQNVIGLDGVAVFVKADQPALQIDIPTLRNIFTCIVTDWSGVAGSGKTGPIVAYRRNDNSGTTDTFRTLVGLSAFGACVTVVDTTEEIAERTSLEPGAIAYAGLSGERPGANRPLAVSVAAQGPFVAPAVPTIRNFSYPLARRLFLSVAGGSRVPSPDEQALVDRVLDRSFFDPILITNEFVTCAATGCP